MGIKGLYDLCSDSPCLLHTTWRKQPNQAPPISTWFDLSMSAGYPIPNYYASNPLEARYMSYSRQKGIYHGHGAYQDKFIYESMVMSTGTTQWTNTPMILLDYLLYYPFLDEGSTDEQFMDNTETLPRFIDGQGVQMMAVSLGGRAGGQTMVVNYTNQDGVSGRQTPLIRGNNVSNINGTMMNTTGTLSVQGATPFLPLQSGDSGVRSVQSFQMISGGDTGIFALVLVKPVATIGFYETANISYKNFISDGGLVPPKIENDAYLNFIIMSTGAFTGQSLYGSLNFLVK